MSSVASVRLIANYLPQFHPIPENDLWWGLGFTEWTNVARAVPLFSGHCQPRIPADLGYYDLRVPETREAQAALAAAHGIEAFCYWHYWFSGKLLLERPLEEVVRSGAPNFPFCVAWANESWSGVWHGAPEKILIRQEYPGIEDHVKHFYYLLPMFSDPRYVLVDGKPLVMIFRPEAIPELQRFLDTWRTLALKEGLSGLHIIGYQPDTWDARAAGFDGATWAYQSVLRGLRGDDAARLETVRAQGRPDYTFEYEDAVPYMHGPLYPNYPVADDHYPSIVTGWDNSPRSGSAATILHGMTPESFRAHVRNVFARVLHKAPENRIVFVKSWNEWAEGNYLEPDALYGDTLLRVVKEELDAIAADRIP